MASVTYTCQFGSELSLSARPSASLTGSSGTIPADAVIKKVSFSVYCGVSKWNQTVTCGMTLTDSSGSSVSISDNCDTGSENRVWITISGKPSASLDWDSLSTVTLSGTSLLTVRTSYTATLTIEYTTYSSCGAPTSVSFSNSSAAPGARVSLQWSGATSGENNAIAGYEIYRSDTPDGGYGLLTAVSSKYAAGSTIVSAPSTNGATYYFKVVTVGEAGYNSPMSTVYAELTCAYASVTAPTKVEVEVSNVAPESVVMLYWSGATAGENNAIKGYEIWKATDGPDGLYSLWTTVDSTFTAAGQRVLAPYANGETHYYRVKTLGTLGGYDSELSTAYAALTSTYSVPTAPSTVTIGGKTSVYSEPGATVLLEWSGAVGGVNNNIAGYTVYRDGEEYAAGLAASATSCSVVAHDTAGNAYSYTVVTLGTYIHTFYGQTISVQSAPCVVYSYEDPTAPPELTVSKDMPAAGAKVVLSWSGAAPGGYNDINGYRVYRATVPDGAYTQVASAASTDTAASCYVVAPSTPGEYYYFKVETVGSYSTSGLSEVYVAVGAIEATEGTDDEVEVIVPAPQKRSPRGFLLGDYDTAAKGWTLAGWSFPEPEPQTNYTTVPGRSKGPLDQSTALTNGDPYFDIRPLTIRLERSDGTRLDRYEHIEELVSRLHGMRVDIVFPDDKTRYAVGRLKVQTEYNDMAHAALNITGDCEPWRYSQQETRIALQAFEDENTAVLFNSGRLVIVPTVEVSGFGAYVYMECGGREWELEAGTYRLPELTLARGNTLLTYHGYGDIVFTYREAVI